MSEQARHWSRAAEGDEEAFIDPYLPEARNPLRESVAALQTSPADVFLLRGTGRPVYSFYTRAAWFDPLLSPR